MYHQVCILIMAHGQEDLLLRLLDRLAHPQLAVYIHIDKKAQALFETTAEVLTGLRAAYEHYETGAEKAMR